MSRSFHIRPYGQTLGKELLSSEQIPLLQRAALETANPIFLTDNRGIIIWVNTLFITLTGYSAEEVIGKTPRLLKSGQQDEEFYLSLPQ